MKKIFSTAFIITSLFAYSQNFELSTIRIGDFKLFNDKTTVDEFVKKTLPVDGPLDGFNKVSYNGENIEVYFVENFYKQQNPTAKNIIFGLSTASRAFKTKSGMGVGSSREELINAYKSYPNFSVFTYKDESRPSVTFSTLSLKDNDAGTSINFNLENNIVVKVHVSIEEGC